MRAPHDEHDVPCLDHISHCVTFVTGAVRLRARHDIRGHVVIGDLVDCDCDTNAAKHAQDWQQIYNRETDADAGAAVQSIACRLSLNGVSTKTARINRLLMPSVDG